MANCKAGSPGATIEKYRGCYDNSSTTCSLYLDLEGEPDGWLTPQVRRH